MPSSLRLLAGLVLLSIAAAIASAIVINAQDMAQARTTAEQLTGGSVSAGKHAFQAYGCSACHAIKTLPGADGQVGPSLDQIATQAQLAGHLANSPANMARWIQHPQQVDPGNGMPETGVSDQDARNISAYLYTLR